MAQYLKDSVREGILQGALVVLAERGYDGTTMADIAQASSISVGNIYRYYKSKTELYETLISDEFVAQFGELVRRRVKALGSAPDINELEPSNPYHVASEQLFRFSVQNRLRIVVLLGRSAGTRRETYREELLEDLVGMAVEYAKGLDMGFEPTKIGMFTIRLVYRNYLDGLCRILSEYEEERSTRLAVDGYSRYHLAGMKALLEDGGKRSSSE